MKEPKQHKFLKPNTITRYVIDKLKFRISQKAITPLLERLNFIISTVLTESKALSESARRRTITAEDMLPSLEKHVGKRRLIWDEILSELILQSPADLGKVSKGINDYIEQHKLTKK
ncbi:MAG: hypothetical protein AUJ85_01235 [Elusimicrobia bacterium CG1_02_37_114]|nr:MAG: hypothetical protein AUJ85_01235 [Elusimicrobia bacterium CG1_02_37_114]